MLKQTGLAVMVLAAMLAGCGGGDTTSATVSDDGATPVAETVDADGTAEAAAGGIPDGVYTCSYNSGGMLYTLGKLQIRGNQYSGFSGDAWGTYSGSQETSFTFHDGLVGLPDGYTVTASRWLTSSYSGDEYLEITYVSPSGNQMKTTCET